MIIKSNLTFGELPHPLVLPIIKHEVKLSWTYTYINHEMEEREASYTYFSRMIGILNL
jgi:hypothetical protein